ncbi:toxin-antitoxin system YwqK family antitoxin [Psychroserpens sp. NJDZ02]|uniref:toxin-antitoxin system YwqK family antitoxin n=1 Tax=Psychroserpens sp. NJDZ02 TaxID=2570561 RepID=UPI0014562DF8|nr:toxin-antitoxin system YwqK family antitoxin [Psychroserpens sp. NJDZ02]
MKNTILIITLICLSISLYSQEKSNDSVNTKSDTIVKHKDGKWQWYYDNGKLGELGFYSNGEKDGEWKWYFKNGAIKTTGSYKNGNPEGDRKWYYSNDKLYCKGQYSNGKRDGKWEWNSETGDQIQRIIINFNKGVVTEYVVLDNSGNTIFKHNGNSTTIVKFQESYSFLSVFYFFIEEPNGYNLYFNGDVLYFTKQKDNEAHGQSKTYSNDGKLYSIRNYKNGKRHGEFQRYDEQGKLSSSCNYKNGKETGVCKLYYENGQLKEKGRKKNGKYVGEWKTYSQNGLLKGLRKYHKDNVTSFDSKGRIEHKFIYTKNKKEKKDITYFKNGNLKKVISLKNDKFHGENKEYYENGNIKEITPYINGKIHGEWVKYNENGILTIRTIIKNGDYSESHITGFYPNGQISRIGFKNKGPYKWYFKNGQLKEINNYKDGQEHGENKKYYENGQIKFEGKHYEGERDGKFIWYKKNGDIILASEYNHESAYSFGEWKYFGNGQLESVELYERDSLVEWKYYYKTGEIEKLRQYHKKGVLTGEWKDYYKNGQVRLIAYYKDEIPQNDFKLYHENGQLYKTQTYKYPSKLMEIISCFDNQGNILDRGTLKNGTGIVKEYNSKGRLINSVEYKNGYPIKDNSVDAIWLDSDKLNSLAWEVYKEENNVTKLNFAIKWIKQSIDLEETYNNTDTYAALLYKTGNYKQAIIIAKKAIRIAEENGREKIKTTEKLIEKINLKLKN